MCENTKDEEINQILITYSTIDAHFKPRSDEMAESPMTAAQHNTLALDRSIITHPSPEGAFLLVSGPFDVAPRHYSIIERPSAAAVDKTVTHAPQTSFGVMSTPSTVYPGP